MNDQEEPMTTALRRAADSVAARAAMPEPADVRLGANRHRRAKRSSVLGVLAVLAIGLPFAIAAVQARHVPLPPTPPLHRHPTPLPRLHLPRVDLAATPPGWVPVDFGRAQISVPATWHLEFDTACDFPASPGTIFVGRTGFGRCAAVPPPQRDRPMVLLEPAFAGYIPAAGGRSRMLRINGISALEENAGGMLVTYVPSLGVMVYEAGGPAQDVIRTLTRSPRAVALDRGPAPAVPASWRRLTFAGISVAVPRSWPVVRTAAFWGVDGDPCASWPQGAMLQYGTGVTLSSGRLQGEAKCISGQVTSGPDEPLVRWASLGLVVNAGSFAPSMAMSGPGAQVVSQATHGLVVSVQTASSATFGVLEVGVVVPGQARPIELSIGLAGDGIVARTILDSIRPAG